MSKRKFLYNMIQKVRNISKYAYQRGKDLFKKKIFIPAHLNIKIIWWRSQMYTHKHLTHKT